MNIELFHNQFPEEWLRHNFQRLVWEQVERDFSRVGATFESPESMSMGAQEACSWLTVFLKKVPDADWLNFLYLIDLPQQALSLPLNNQEDWHQMAEWILKREGLKVWFRTQLSKLDE